MVSKIGRNESAYWAFLDAVIFGPVSMGNLEHLADEIAQCARAQGLTICTAESCSAGRLALALSKTEGASQHFMGGVITYTKEMKTRLLGVPPDLIQRGTAVCAEVAEAMAQGVVACSKSDLGVSITGVAGPEPDEDGNPVGLVYCAVAGAGMIKHIKLRCESKNPDEIIDEACIEALKLLRSFCLSSASTDVQSCNV
jgi:nicotinamide-nucleotide amidase